ncbi:MAG TPA: metallophosphoesterase family protein [Patescibacteria group bacterium]|nr:metallophosphoesterase family protein [Patescibacteria group bacterium]
MPRYLLLSDIHANLTALEAVLAAAEGSWDRVICLGDVVGYGPDPNEVIDRMVQMGIQTIRGNHDKAASGEGGDDFNPVARAAIDWTRRQLRPENRRWLQALPSGPLGIDGWACVHGSVDDEDEYVFSEEDAARSLRHSPSPITFFGHTHVQGGFLLRNERVEGFRPPLLAGGESAPWELDPAARYMINPGSVGQPRDRDPRAAFAVADGDSQAIEFRRTAYDIASVQERMEGAGLPEPLVLRLAFGR